MSLQVRILSENLANKISAGEVVERPASIVKELVENSIDAGATEIRLEISSGGKRIVRVTDNGSGMSKEDALLAFERHATSKIRNDEDLDAISTLGFRGEALPAITAVSRLRLKTREHTSIEGTEIYIEGGRVRDVKACGMPPGTDITVEQLFYNTPARLKFLRSSATEAAHVGDLMVRLAISRPDISFRYVNDGREVFHASASSLLQRLQDILPKGTGLFPVEGGAGTVSLTGYIAPPDAAKSAHTYMFTFINGRFVRDRVVQHAIMQAWRPVLEKGRYPVLAIFIELPPAEVDVNVHPTKHEVRFRHQKQVHDIIHDLLSQTLGASPWLSPQTQSSAQPQMNNHGKTHPPYQDVADRVRQAVDNFISKEQAPLFRHTGNIVREAVTDYSRDQESSTDTSGYFSSLSVIGQLRGAYILCESEDGLIIIDQHAAYERIRFEQLRKAYRTDRIGSQLLLVPEVLEFSFSEADTISNNLERLASMGFEIEGFGGNTFRLNAVPEISPPSGHTALLQSLIHEIEATGSSESFDILLDKLLSTIACHSVTRGTRILGRIQINELLSEMDRTDFSAHCPHGRPVSHRIPIQELEKFFRRT